MSNATKDKDANKDETKVTVKPEIQELADRIRKDMKLEKSGTEMVGTVSAELYASGLPEGLTTDSVKSLQQYHSAIAAAGLLALGEESIKAMKKHKDVTGSSLEIPTVGKDSFEFNFQRSKQVTNPGNTDAGPKTKFGVGNVGFNMYGAGNRAEVKKVKQLLGDQALAAFGS